MTTIHCVDAQNQPLADAIVAVASAPQQTNDIGMITDANGDVSINVKAPGAYVFSIAHGGQTHSVSVNLTPGDSMATVKLQ